MIITKEAKSIGKEMQECIQACKECYKMCMEGMIYCMEMGGNYMEGLMMHDCAEMCQMSMNTMLMGSEFTGRTCEFCAEVCMCCADRCDMMGDDPKMKAYAECCRRCGEMCKQVSMTMMKTA